MCGFYNKENSRSTLYEGLEYQKWLDEMEKDCTCCPICSEVPCDGVCAGGFCDEMCTCNEEYDDQLYYDEHDYGE